jgi:DNA-binding NarL/FixJ family response regulator
MRVVLVGTADDRARVRRDLPVAMEVVGEFASLAAARAAATPADGILLANPDGLDTDRAETLTPREVQVLDLLVEGLSNKAIAAKLGISDQTVKFHVAAICGKLGAANRTDAVRHAIRRGIVAV